MNMILSLLYVYFMIYKIDHNIIHVNVTNLMAVGKMENIYDM